MGEEEVLAMQDLNTTYPGTIVSFDPTEQTAVVRIAIEKFFSGMDTAELYEDAERPLLTDVPVHFPQCKGFSLTMPVEEGDSCLLIFAQRGLGHWLYRAEEKAGRDPVSGWPAKELNQRFELSNTLCIVGFNPIPKAITDFNPTDAEWRNADRSQRMTLLANNEIEVVTTQNVTITTPTNVNINCEEAIVTAVTKVTLDTPLTHATGNLLVDGSIHAGVNVTAAAIVGAPAILSPGPGSFAGGGVVAGGTVSMEAGTLTTSDDVIVGGNVTATGDVTASGTSLKTHVHAGDGGTGSAGDTGPPL